MPETPPIEPRESQKLKARVDEIERTVKIMVKAVAALEDEAECFTLPKGVYCGETVD